MNQAISNILTSTLKACSLALRGTANALTQVAAHLDFARALHLDFRIRPSDVFVVTYPRSGTTWTQMIVYQLLTDGRLDFPHITQVSPWFERSVSITGRNLEEVPAPRILKSHLDYRQIPKGDARYIYVMRNGADVATSYYHFYCTHLGFTQDFDAFFKLFLAGRLQFGAWFTHVAGWHAHRNDPNVLFITYEAMRDDLAAVIRQMITFLELEISESRLADILPRCSFAFMKAHENKFDHISGMIWEKGYQQHAFIRKGEVGRGHTALNASQKATFNRQLDRAFAAQLAARKAPEGLRMS